MTPTIPHATGNPDKIRSPWPPVQEKIHWTALWLLLVVAFGLRLIAFFVFLQAGGDGPSRALQAYMWYETPVFRPHAFWLPGYIYLTGMFHGIVHDPMLSTRIFNLICGTLTVPVFYLLLRHVYANGATALVGAGLLTV